jgi:hypothetical protein
MKELNEGEAKEYLLAMAKSRGYKVSSDQLNRWHRAGLLPRPRQVLLGRRGSKTVYPNGSAEQVIEICRIHEKERRLAYVAWQLWWNGFEVKLGTVRDFIQRSAKTIDEGRRKCYWLNSETVKREIEASGEARFENKVIRKARKRIGKSQLPSFLETMLAVATGQYSKESSEAQSDQMDLEKALGLENAREQRIGTIGPWLSGEQLNDISEIFGKLNFSAILSDTIDDELIQARDEFRVVFDSLGSVGQVMDKTFGKAAFAFSAVGGLLQNTPATFQPLLLLFWIACRKNKDTEESAKLLIENKNKCATLISLDKAFETMKTEIPDIVAILSPKKMKARMRSPKAGEKHLEEMKQFYTEHQKEMDGFLEKHPEFRLAED